MIAQSIDIPGEGNPYIKSWAIIYHCHCGCNPPLQHLDYCNSYESTVKHTARLVLAGYHDIRVETSRF